MFSKTSVKKFPWSHILFLNQQEDEKLRYDDILCHVLARMILENSYSGTRTNMFVDHWIKPPPESLQIAFILRITVLKCEHSCRHYLYVHPFTFSDIFFNLIMASDQSVSLTVIKNIKNIQNTTCFPFKTKVSSHIFSEMLLYKRYIAFQKSFTL